MGSRLNGRFNFRTLNMNYIKMLDYFHHEVHGRMKSVETFRYGIRVMFGFLAKECSPIFAQRVIRSYRALQLHSKLWSNHVASLTKSSKPNSKRWVLGLVMYSLCHPKFSTIDNEELKSHQDDLDYIHKLTAATVVCPNCKDRLVISKKIPNIKYCHCPNTDTPYNKISPGFPWAPFVETPDLIIWRKPHPEFEGLYTYKVYGYYDDISPEDFLTTQLDLEYRKKWDNLVLQLKIIDQDEGSLSEVVHWEMKWPKMFSNRDYCFVRRHLVDKQQKSIVIMSKAIKHPNCPESKGIVRVKEYWSIMLIKAVKGMDDKGVEFGLTYFDNPGLSLPTWLTNWAAIAAIPDFLNKVRQAARDKRAELEKNQKPAPPGSTQLGPAPKISRVSNPNGDAKSGAASSKGSPRPTKTKETAKTRESKTNKSKEPTDSTANPSSEGNKNSAAVQKSSSVSPSVPAATSGAPNSLNTNSNAGGNTSSSNENGEILSQFFKDNFLTSPNPLNDG